MAIFPESTRRKPQFGYDTTPAENVKRTAAEAGNSYWRDSWGVTRFQATMEFVLRTVDANVLWAWWIVNRSASSFTFFDFDVISVAALQIATGDGAAVIFTVPGKEIDLTDFAVFVAGTARTFTTSRNSGALGEDRVTVAGAVPTVGQAITITGSLRRRYTCEFVDAPSRRAMGFNKIGISMRIRQKFPIVGLG